MTIFVRSKRVTAPLNDEARARLRGELNPTSTSTSTSTTSSGSEHHNSPCLSTLIHAFLENPTPTTTSTAADDDSAPPSTHRPATTTTSPETIRTLLVPPADDDQFRANLLSSVNTAINTLGGPHRRAVMAALRTAGYNAGLCKSRWPATGGLTAGTYDYIDVVTSSARYIIDVNFAVEFEIARPTEGYENLVAALPRVAVATPEEMGKAVKMVAEAAERSMRSQGLSVPPWRKGRYMVAKWLGSYRRTVNPLPAALMGGAGEVTCRFVGFHAEAGPFVTRTQ